MFNCWQSEVLRHLFIHDFVNKCEDIVLYNLFQVIDCVVSSLLDSPKFILKVVSDLILNFQYLPSPVFTQHLFLVCNREFYYARCLVHPIDLDDLFSLPHYKLHWRGWGWIVNFECESWSHYALPLRLSRCNTPSYDSGRSLPPIFNFLGFGGLVWDFSTSSIVEAFPFAHWWIPVTHNI